MFSSVIMVGVSQNNILSRLKIPFFPRIFMSVKKPVSRCTTTAHNLSLEVIFGPPLLSRFHATVHTKFINQFYTGSGGLKHLPTGKPTNQPTNPAGTRRRESAAVQPHHDGVQPQRAEQLSKTARFLPHVFPW